MRHPTPPTSFRKALAALLVCCPALAYAADPPPPIWALDGGLTRVSENNLNRLFSEFPVDARPRLQDAAWRWTGGLTFRPRFPESLPLRFDYHYTDQGYENLKAFNFHASNVGVEASLPVFLRLHPRLGAGMDWSTDSQGLTGNARWGSAGLDFFGTFLTAVRLDANLQRSTFDFSDRSADQLGLRALLVKSVLPKLNVYAQYHFTSNEAANREEFSYRENLAEGGLIWRHRDWLEWALRYQAHFRRYVAVDPRFGLRRDETLHDVFLNARLFLVEGLLSTFGSLQWEKNVSNADIKNYDAMIFTFGLQLSL